MKSRLFSKLIIAATMGALFGAWIHSTHVKWHQLGREAYLLHQSQWFEKHMAGPSSGKIQVIEWSIAAIILCAIYEGLADLVSKILTPTAKQ